MAYYNDKINIRICLRIQPVNGYKKIPRPNLIAS